MCSVNEDELNEVSEMLKTELKPLSESDICRKCTVNKAEITLRGKDFYCNQCFLVYFTHKFRSTIGKSKEIKHGDKILVVYFGDLSSTSLLHLIYNGLNEDSMKRLRFDPAVLFINECILHPEYLSVEKLYEKLSVLGFPFYSVNLEEVLKPEDRELSIYTSEDIKHISSEKGKFPENEELRNEFSQLISKLKSQTSQEDFIFHLQQELISRCANQLGFKKVFLGDNGTELAVKILTDIALGRGAQLSDHVHFKAGHFGVEVFRPMREIFEDEIKLYSQCEKVTPLVEVNEKHQNEKPDISSCTRNFVLELQKEFLSTVPTIFKTGGKLVSGNFSDIESLPSMVSENSVGESDVYRRLKEECLFCGFSKDNVTNSISASDSIKVSKILSTTPPPQIKSENGDKCEKYIPSIPENVEVLNEEEISQNFCYGCANIFREMKSLEDCPTRVREKLREIKRRKQSLKIIEDCLL